MRNLNKAIAIICLTAVMICIGYRIKVRADDIPWAPEVLQQNGVGDLTGIGFAYTSLTSEQKTIAAYLIGAFNNIYLMARGFSYSIPANETAWKAQFIALGEKVWQFATTAYGWKSRFNETFRQYLSSVCVYASGISTTFEAWYQANTGTGELYIPYSEDAFTAWTEFYNDPSGDGIASFGLEMTDWQSGVYYDFQFAGIPWGDSSSANTYNNFILNYNPIIYSNAVDDRPNGNRYFQWVLKPDTDHGIIDTVFVLRSSNNLFTQARYGYSYPSYTILSQQQDDLAVYLYLYGDELYSIRTLARNIRYNIITFNTPLSIKDLLTQVFFKTPFQFFSDTSASGGYYPFVAHVVLVDDLNTLSNPEEIYNVSDLNIVAPDPVREPYILAPNDRLLFPTRPIGYDDPLGFWDIVIDNSVDENGDSVSENDFHQQIVNNTTINNYYVTNDDRINVPVEWFENDLTDQLANDSIPFLTFARDCIDTLGDLQIYLYGAVVFGLGGGILKKFLL